MEPGSLRGVGRGEDNYRNEQPMADLSTTFHDWKVLQDRMLLDYTATVVQFNLRSFHQLSPYGEMLQNSFHTGYLTALTVL